MKTTLVGLLLNLLFTLALMGGVFTDYDTEFVSPLGIVLLALWGLSVLGFVLVMAGRGKWGSILVIAGSIVFIPLGIVAMIGARKLREGHEVEQKKASDIVKFYATRQVPMFVFGIIFFVLLGAWALVETGDIPGTFLMFTIIFGFMAFWMSTVPMMEFHDDHVIFRLSPIRVRKSFLYSEITTVERKKRKYLVHYRKNSKAPGDAPRTFKFPLSVFSKSDHGRLDLVMQNRLRSCKENNKKANENISERGM